MRFNLALVVLLELCRLAHTSVLPARELEQRDLVHDVVILLQILHASAFCSSFAPEGTVIVPATATTSRTTTTTTTTTTSLVVSNTASTTTTLIVPTTIVVQSTETDTATRIDTVFVTTIITTTKTSTQSLVSTSNYVVNQAAKRGAVNKPPALIQYADNIISSACHSYIPSPTRTTTLTTTAQFTNVVSQTQTSTVQITSATAIIVTTLITSTTKTSITSTTTTLDMSTTLKATTMTTIPTQIAQVATTATYTYSIVTAGTGCGNIAYYNYLQDNTVTTQQCLDFCDADPNCKAVSLQCSQDEPCECEVNNHPYQNGDLQCALPTLYYGPFTFYNKL